MCLLLALLAVAAAAHSIDDGAALQDDPQVSAAVAGTGGTIYVVRHGEMDTSTHTLNDKGQRRAEYLVSIFNGNKFEAPKSIIAGQVGSKSTSHQRMQETVTPLANHLGITIDTGVSVEDDKAGAQAALKALSKGTVLVAWWSEISGLCKHLGHTCSDFEKYDQVRVIKVQNGKVVSIANMNEDFHGEMVESMAVEKLGTGHGRRRSHHAGGGDGTIYMFRHGEKNSAGDLSSTGRARAKYIATIFGSGGMYHQPQSCFAGRYGRDTPQRTLHTIQPLASKFQLHVDNDIENHDHSGAAKQFLAKINEGHGVVAVAWEHANIHSVCYALASESMCPYHHWSGSDYDSVLIYTVRDGRVTSIEHKQEGFKNIANATIVV